MAEFISLADQLREPAQVRVQPAAEVAGPPVPRFEPAASRIVAELPLLRLAAIEAFERAAETLLRAFADEVLGRELALAPCDIEGVMRRLLVEFEAEEPVVLLTARGSKTPFQGLAVLADPALGPGDVLVRVRDGVIDARFAVRAGEALERAPAGR